MIILKAMMSVLLEGVLDEELDEELGYSKYDYRNKDTDNSRNGHSRKAMHTSYGDMDLVIVSATIYMNYHHVNGSVPTDVLPSVTV